MNNPIIDGPKKSYGDLQILHGISFQVHPGGIYGFAGFNGAGKTTIMRTVLGVLTINKNEVHIGGTPMNDSLRRTIDYIPEERDLYPKAEVCKRLIYFAHLYGMPVERAESNVENLLERLGLTERANDKADVLSLGNQQRVQLAASLIHDPEVFVLDEPFSGLDLAAVKVMSSVLEEYAGRGTSIVFSPHQFDLVERMRGRIGTIRDGRMLVEGTVEGLRAHGPWAFVVKLDDMPQDQASSVEGVTSVECDARGATVVHLSSNAPADTDQKLLHGAMAAGTVRSLEPLQAPLIELYQEAVQQ